MTPFPVQSTVIICFRGKKVLKLERKKLNYDNLNHTRERMKTNQKKR